MANLQQKSKRKRGVILSPVGWQRLQEAQEQSAREANNGQPYTLEELNEITGLSSHTLTKVSRRKNPVDKRSLEDYFSAFNLTIAPSDYLKSTSATQSQKEKIIPIQQDWGEAIDVSVFYGRTEELATLETWIKIDRCRLIAVLGMGGIGKTALAVKIAQQLQEQFEYVIWRSLRNAPPLETLLSELVIFLSAGQETQGEIRVLLQYLRSSRNLIILDNVETILRSGDRAGQYRTGYENYGQLFRLIGETAHSSCLILTSREKPAEVAATEGIELSVRSLQLKGSPEAAQKLIQAKRLSGSEKEKQILGDRYGSNPLALKIVATSIQDLFDGQIGEFLAQDTTVFNSLQKLLDQQFVRLSALEKTIMYWLAINREWTTIAELLEDIVPAVSRGNLLEALESLIWRSLIEKQSGTYTQQSVVMEYVTESLIEKVTHEITQASSPQYSCTPAPLPLFHSHALLKTTVKDYVRESQIRLILEPIAAQLHTTFGSLRAIEQQIQKILQLLRESQASLSGYGAGNLINLAHHLRIDLTGYDFSDLRIWQAYLQGVNLQKVNFAHANLAKSVFTHIFGSILAVAFSPNGKFLAAGDTKGKVHLWQVAPSRSLLTFQGHTSWVLSLVWSPDGQTLASSSYDRTIRLWNPLTGQCVKTFTGHTNWVLSLAWSPDGKILASGGDDQTIRLWDLSNGKCLKILTGHTNWVMSVAWSPDGKTLASGGDDQTIRLWDLRNGKCLKILTGHTNWVRSVAWSPDGQNLASGSDDQTIKIWHSYTGRCLKTLTGHTYWVSSVAWSPNGQNLASSSHDQTVKLWDINKGKCLKTLHGHTKWVWSIAWSPDGKVLASGSYDQSVRLWNFSTGQCLRTLQGYTNGVFSVAWSPDGQTLASSSQDQTVKLWDVYKEKCLKTFTGHTGWVWSVVISPNGQIIASGSDDQTLKLWDIKQGKCLKTFTGHTGLVWSVAISPNGQIIASGSNDRTVKLWDISTGHCLLSLEGHNDSVHSVAWSPDGQTLASGSYDQTVKLWNPKTGECVLSLEGHENWVRSVAWSPNGKILASSSYDQTVRLWDIQQSKCLKVLQGNISQVGSVAWSLDGKAIATSSADETIKLWDVNTGKCLKILQGHTNQVGAVAISPDGKTIASSSVDETIKLWDINTGDCLTTLRAERPYEGMNIIGITGLTENQKETLKVLGAVEK
ncbi:MAG: NB-ARC domain-containing protein [Xenococcaceae cyanobacterium MO_188.B29]|nr:NB-ARC domain-containing protein [Xenococcaceae cyanobacterium MO_188.B29]